MYSKEKNSIEIFLVGAFAMLLVGYAILSGFLSFDFSTSDANQSITLGTRVTAPIGVNVFDDPTGTYQFTQTQDSKGTVVNGPKPVIGAIWWNIIWDDGTQGWSVVSAGDYVFLEPAQESLTPISNVGARVKVVFSLLGVNDEPSGTLLSTKSTGGEGIVTEGPIYNGGAPWWKILWDDGSEGWSVEEVGGFRFLTQISQGTPPLGPQVFFSDVFTDSDKLLTNHTPNNGDSWSLGYSEGGGNGYIKDGVLIDDGVGGANDGYVMIANPQIPIPDYRVAITATESDSGDDTTTLVARWQDPNNTYAYMFSGSRNSSYNRLLKRVNGTWTVLSKDCDRVKDGDAVAIEVEGTTIKAVKNGTTLCQATDSSITQPGHGGVGHGAFYDTRHDLSQQESDNFIIHTLDSGFPKPFEPPPPPPSTFKVERRDDQGNLMSDTEGRIGSSGYSQNPAINTNVTGPNITVGATNLDGYTETASYCVTSSNDCTNYAPLTLECSTPICGGTVGNVAGQMHKVVVKYEGGEEVPENCDNSISPSEHIWNNPWGFWGSSTQEPDVNYCEGNNRSGILSTSSEPITAAALELNSNPASYLYRRSDVSFKVLSENFENWNHVAVFPSWEKHSSNDSYGRIGAAIFKDQLAIQINMGSLANCGSTNLYEWKNLSNMIQPDHWYRASAGIFQLNSSLEVQVSLIDNSSGNLLAKASKVFPPTCTPNWYNSNNNTRGFGLLTNKPDAVQPSVSAVFDDYIWK